LGKGRIDGRKGAGIRASKKGGKARLRCEKRSFALKESEKKKGRCQTTGRRGKGGEGNTPNTIVEKKKSPKFVAKKLEKEGAARAVPTTGRQQEDDIDKTGNKGKLKICILGGLRGKKEGGGQLSRKK